MEAAWVMKSGNNGMRMWKNAGGTRLAECGTRAETQGSRHAIGFLRK
jgi:hypothetical protein